MCMCVYVYLVIDVDPSNYLTLFTTAFAMFSFPQWQITFQTFDELYKGIKVYSFRGNPVKQMKFVNEGVWTTMSKYNVLAKKWKIIDKKQTLCKWIDQFTVTFISASSLLLIVYKFKELEAFFVFMEWNQRYLMLSSASILLHFIIVLNHIKERKEKNLRLEPQNIYFSQ